MRVVHGGFLTKNFLSSFGEQYLCVSRLKSWISAYKSRSASIHQKKPIGTAPKVMQEARDELQKVSNHVLAGKNLFQINQIMGVAYMKGTLLLKTG